jgi:hypothetical protein
VLVVADEPPWLGGLVAPVSVALWFAHASAGSWQVAQLMVLSADSRGSK